MPPVQEHIHLTLTPKDDGSDGYDLSQNPNEVPQVMDGKNRMKVGKKHRYILNYTLGDNSLSFDGKAAEVFLVKAGEACPARTDTKPNRNFGNFKISADGMTLSVTNKNIDEGSFAYRILIKDGDDPRDFDPVIINGGGGQDDKGGLMTAVLIVLGVCALVGIAYYTGLLKWLFG